MDANPGPIDGSILYDQDKHVSAAVWDGQERGALRCHEHTSKLGEWRLTARQVELVERAGFGYLRKIPAISLDNPLISALVERWRRETNTFHFGVGEMTVTLQDVALLLGLAIDGRPVIGITYTTCSSVCERLLGRSPDSRYASGGMVKLSWLKEFFSHCPENASIEEVERCTRAYLLYLVGSTIFSTTTGNKVPVMYLPLFENFQEAGNFAWGAAALAFLYRALGNACVKSQSTICGCLTLLQCWSYFHLNIGRPKLHRESVHDHFPFVLRWKGKQSGPTTNRDVVFYRKALDSLKPSDVEWLPYKYMDSTVIPESIRDTLILGRSKTMLICFDKAERHLPDRCLRQYGMLQPIPEDVVRWVRKSRGVDGGVDLSGKMESELNEWSDRRLYIVDGDDGVDEMEYMQWYSRITRKVVGRPISLSSEFQRTISGLRDIAYIADSFSTEGLDKQQLDSIAKIRYIAQDCLKDQVGSPVTPSATPLMEPGKRSRGKERIRRKGSIKRRRKDDAMEYYEGSEDDQSQVYGTVIEVDQLQLRQDDIHELQLSQADDEVDPQQLFLSPDEDNIAQLHVVVNKADDAHLSSITNDNNTSQPCNVTNNNVIESQVCGATMEEINDSEAHDHTNEVIASQFCQGTTNEVHGSNPDNLTSKVNDQEMHDATINEAIELSEPSKAARDSHIPDATKDIRDSQLPDVSKEGNGSQLQLPEATGCGKDLQHPGATEEENGSQLPGATIAGQNLQILDATEEENRLELPDAANGSQLSDAGIARKDSLLPDATEEENASQPQDAAIAVTVKGLQLPDAIEAEMGSQLSDSIFAGKDLQFPDVTEEENNSQLPGAIEEENNSQLPGATEEGNNSQLPGETISGKDLPFTAATKEEFGSQLHDVSVPDAIEGNDSRLSDAAIAGKVSDLPNAIEQGSGLQLPDAAIKDQGSKPLDPTEKGSVSQLPEAAEKIKGSQLQDSAEEPKDLPLQEAAEKGRDLQHLDTTDRRNDPHFSDATEDKDLQLQNEIKEGKDSQISDTTKGGELLPPNTTGETNDSHPPDAIDATNASNLSHSSDGNDSSAAKAATNNVPG